MRSFVAVALCLLFPVAVSACGGDDDGGNAASSAKVQEQVETLAVEQLKKRGVKADLFPQIACARASDDSNDYKCAGTVKVHSACDLGLSGTFTADDNAVVGALDVDEDRCANPDGNPETVEANNATLREICSGRSEIPASEVDDCSLYEDDE